MKVKIKIIFKESRTLINVLQNENFKRLINDSDFDEIELMADERKNETNYFYEKANSDLPLIVSIFISTIAIGVAVITILHS